MNLSPKLVAAWIALIVGGFIFIAKISAYLITDSMMILSDALESLINIAAALILLLILNYAARPPDSTHPYGHGKAESVSAAIEGSLIILAGFFILIESIGDMIGENELRSLGTGLIIVFCAGTANGCLALYLLKTGKKHNSPALIADGYHILTDLWTSAGVIIGILMTRLTGWILLDPLAAIAFALLLFFHGGRIVRNTIRELMNAADKGLLRTIIRRLTADREDSWINIHFLRAWRSGSFLYVDMHLIVPHYFEVSRLHTIQEKVKKAVLRNEEGGDFIIHFDPCQPHYCSSCAVKNCPVRKAACIKQDPLSYGSVVHRRSPLSLVRSAAAKTSAADNPD